MFYTVIIKPVHISVRSEGPFIFLLAHLPFLILSFHSFSCLFTYRSSYLSSLPLTWPFTCHFSNLSIHSFSCYLIFCSLTFRLATQIF